MPAPARAAANVSRLYWGSRREYGLRRTSATAWTRCRFSISRNLGVGWRECPTVRIMGLRSNQPSPIEVRRSPGWPRLLMRGEGAHEDRSARHRAKSVLEESQWDRQTRRILVPESQ